MVRTRLDLQSLFQQLLQSLLNRNLQQMTADVNNEIIQRHAAEGSVLSIQHRARQNRDSKNQVLYLATWS